MSQNQEDREGFNKEKGEDLTITNPDVQGAVSIVSESQSSPVSMVIRSRQFTSYPVSAEELEILESGLNSIKLTLLGVCVGIFFTLFITWLNEAVPLTDWINAIFIALMVAFLFLTVLLSAMVFKEEQSRSRVVKKIREGN